MIEALEHEHEPFGHHAFHEEAQAGIDAREPECVFDHVHDEQDDHAGCRLYRSNEEESGNCDNKSEQTIHRQTIIAFKTLSMTPVTSLLSALSAPSSSNTMIGSDIVPPLRLIRIRRPNHTESHDRVP